MKIVRSGKFVKIVAKKYKDVVGDFAFLSEKKRLIPEERFMLIQKLILNHLNELGKSSVPQEKHAAEIMIVDPFTYDITRINRRDHIQWRVSINGFYINVPSELVSDCPSKYLKHKNEF